MTEICGYELKNGKKCSRPAGWGTDEDKGHCKDHRESKNQSLKKNFIEYLQNNLTSMKEAANYINRHESTIWKWRQQDPEFNEKVIEAKNKQKNMRVDRVKDSMFQRIVKGDASASETIFWLKNNTAWQTNPDTIVNVNQAQKQENKSLNMIDRARKVMDEIEEEA